MTAELVCAASDRAAWLEARRSGVTATDIVTILGLGWSSEYALYWEKLGKLPEWEGNPRTRLGQVLEGYIADHWELAPDRDPADYPGDGGLWRNTDRPWQLATPDRLAHHAPDYPALYDGDPVAGVIELKTWDDHDRAAWEGGMPPKIRAQVLWQMDTLGVGVGHVGVLFLPSGEFESRTVEHHDCEAHGAVHLGKCLDCAPCQDVAYMRQVGEAFWARVREGLPPFPDGSPATLAAVKALHPGDPTGEAEIELRTWEKWQDSRGYLKDAQEAAREAEAELRVLLGDAQFGTVKGEQVVKRTRYEVGANTIKRKAYTVDKLTRLGARKDGDDDM